MRVVDTLVGVDDAKHAVCLAIGVFDGVHRGHQSVLSHATTCAAAAGGQAWVLTFDPHPAAVIHPESAPPLLTSLPHKLRLLEALGADGCAVMPFTPDVARLPPSDFVTRLCDAIPNLKEIFVGENWRFGRGGGGDPAGLHDLAGLRNVSTVVVPPVRWSGDVVSSTRVRTCVANGQLNKAAAMLGRSFSILGTVTRGHSVGRRLGFPTANLETAAEMRPPDGVYAVRVRISGKDHDGVLNIGVRPTFDAGDEPKRTMEVHLPGVDVDLYGDEVEATFVQKLRNEQKFASEQNLKSQIARDIEQAIAVLASHPSAPGDDAPQPRSRAKKGGKKKGQ